MGAMLGGFAVVAFFMLGALQIYLGFKGVEYFGGFWWAWAAVALGVIGRTMLPLTVGTYFGVVNVFHYPWYIGVLAAVPGLIFMIPAIIGNMVSAVKAR